MSPEWAVPLADVHIPEQDIQEVAEVLRSGWISMGPHTERFEHEFAQYTGAGHAVAVTNGTAALHLALVAAGIGPGHQVIVPSLTFVATVAAIEYTGAEPVFADICGVDRPWLSAQACASAVGERTVAIMAMAYGGECGEIEELRELAARRGLTLLEDAAHGAGSRLAGQHLGTFGTAGAFSFYANKNLAIGEGGAVVSDDAELVERVRLLRAHGLSSPAWERHRQGGGYEVRMLGFNYRIDEPRAALARARLRRLDAENRSRQRLDRRYRKLFRDLDLVECCRQSDPRLSSSHHLFPVLLPPGSNRDAVRDRLAGAGVQTSVHYPPVHSLARYRDRPVSLPFTEAYAARTLTLPMFAGLTDAQQDLVVRALRACLS